MTSLLPPSPSVSPRPNASGENKNSRQSMGPTSRNNTAGLTVGSPRPGGVSGSARPTSELVGGNGLFQTPEGLFPYSFSTSSSSTSLSFPLQLRLLTHGSRISKTTRSPWYAVYAHLKPRPYSTLTGRDGCCLSRCQLQRRIERH